MSFLICKKKMRLLLFILIFIYQNVIQCYINKPIISNIKLKRNIELNSIDIAEILNESTRKGLAGASAASVQVMTLMWLRTIVNYQYRTGLNFKESFNVLYQEGGIKRLYQGLPFALLQGPLSRFGDTASNALILESFNNIDILSSLHLPIYIPTIIASLIAGGWRIIIMPVDTIKSNLQVRGDLGIKSLKEKVKENGISILWTGSLAASLATFIGHYPWFSTYNYLNDILPSPEYMHQYLLYGSNFNNDNNIDINIINNIDHVLNNLNNIGSISIATDINIDNIPTTLPSSSSSSSSGIDIDVRALGIIRSAIKGLGASCVSDVCSNCIRVLKTTRQTLVFEQENSYQSDEDKDKENIDNNINDNANYIQMMKDIGPEVFYRGLGTRLGTNAIQSSLFSVLFKIFAGEKN